jgi:hypothetical protein
MLYRKANPIGKDLSYCLKIKILKLHAKVDLNRSIIVASIYRFPPGFDHESVIDIFILPLKHRQYYSEAARVVDVDWSQLNIELLNYIIRESFICIDVGYGNSTRGSEFRVRDEASHITNIEIFGFNLQKITCDVGQTHKVNIKSWIFTLNLIWNSVKLTPILVYKI